MCSCSPATFGIYPFDHNEIHIRPCVVLYFEVYVLVVESSETIRLRRSVLTIQEDRAKADDETPTGSGTSGFEMAVEDTEASVPDYINSFSQVTTPRSCGIF